MIILSERVAPCSTLRTVIPYTIRSRRPPLHFQILAEATLFWVSGMTGPLARKVQRKLSNGVAGFAVGGSSSDRKRSRPIRHFRRMMAKQSAFGQNLAPRAAYLGTAAQRRVVSMSGIRLGVGESA